MPINLLHVAGEAPSARGGHTATVFGDTLVVFGGESATRKVLDEVYVLNLTTATWTCPKTYGFSPAARADHIACAYHRRCATLRLPPLVATLPCFPLTVQGA
eukprot:8848664-Pyramimonas_sp.AAC.1